MWKILRMLWAEPACVWPCLYSFPSWILLLLVTKIEQKTCWFTVAAVYPLSPRTGGNCDCLWASFWFLKARWSHWKPVTRDGQKGSLWVCRVGCWPVLVPCKVCICEHPSLQKHLSFSLWGKKKSTRKCWQIFPACWSCGSITINRTLNWLFESNYKNWLDAYEEINMGQSVAAQWYEFDDLLGHFCV